VPLVATAPTAHAVWINKSQSRIYGLQDSLDRLTKGKAPSRSLNEIRIIVLAIVDAPISVIQPCRHQNSQLTDLSITISVLPYAQERHLSIFKNFLTNLVATIDSKLLSSLLNTISDPIIRIATLKWKQQSQEVIITLQLISTFIIWQLHSTIQLVLFSNL